MDKERIRDFFKLAPIVKQLLTSDKPLNEVEVCIIQGYIELEKEYIGFLKQVNSKEKASEK